MRNVDERGENQVSVCALGYYIEKERTGDKNTPTEPENIDMDLGRSTKSN